MFDDLLSLNLKLLNSFSMNEGIIGFILISSIISVAIFSFNNKKEPFFLKNIQAFLGGITMSLIGFLILLFACNIFIFFTIIGENLDKLILYSTKSTPIICGIIITFAFLINAILYLSYKNKINWQSIYIKIVIGCLGLSCATTLASYISHKDGIHIETVWSIFIIIGLFLLITFGHLNNEKNESNKT